MLSRPNDKEFNESLSLNRESGGSLCRHCSVVLKGRLYETGMIEIPGATSEHPLTEWRSILDTHMPCLHCERGKEMAANFQAEREAAGVAS